MTFINSRLGLVVVANSGEARLFSRQGKGEPLQPLSTLHPAVSSSIDHPEQTGHMAADNRPGGVAFAPKTSPLRKRHMAFARELADRIDQAIADGVCDELVIAASCPFLGELRSSLSPIAKGRLCAEVDLDLTSFGLSEVERRLNDQFKKARNQEN